MKKNFKNDLNPAMQFISQPTNAENNAESPSKRDAELYTELLEKFELPEEGVVPILPTKVTEILSDEREVTQSFVETKSRRLQLLVTPSLFAKLKNKALSETTSVNQLANSILEEAIKE
jgi:hypothetical protein